jgi:hypothetical protein
LLALVGIASQRKGCVSSLRWPQPPACVSDREQRPPIVGRTIIELRRHAGVGLSELLEVVTRPPGRSPADGREFLKPIETQSLDLFVGPTPAHRNHDGPVLESRWQIPDQRYRLRCPCREGPSFEIIADCSHNDCAWSVVTRVQYSAELLGPIPKKRVRLIN